MKNDERIKYPPAIIKVYYADTEKSDDTPDEADHGFDGIEDEF